MVFQVFQIKFWNQLEQCRLFSLVIANDTCRECVFHISDVKKKKKTNLIFEFLEWLSFRICYCIISMHSDANIQMSTVNQQFPKSSASLINSHKFSKNWILFGKKFVGLFSLEKIKYCLKWGFQTMSEKRFSLGGFPSTWIFCIFEILSELIEMATCVIKILIWDTGYTEGPSDDPNILQKIWKDDLRNILKVFAICLFAK